MAGGNDVYMQVRSNKRDVEKSQRAREREREREKGGKREKESERRGERAREINCCEQVNECGRTLPPSCTLSAEIITPQPCSASESARRTGFWFCYLRRTVKSPGAD